ncbi:MAG TPA: hypothetical protein VJR23_14220 [Candidatus Acidoferrales bacterium]|nr:hypothetical protein [Candidatus Acidoferrales bacterium]
MVRTRHNRFDVVRPINAERDAELLRLSSCTHADRIPEQAERGVLNGKSLRVRQKSVIRNESNIRVSAEVGRYDCSGVSPRHGNIDAEKRLKPKGPVFVGYVKTPNIGECKIVASFAFAEEADHFGYGCLKFFGGHQVLVTVQSANFLRDGLLKPPG